MLVSLSDVLIPAKKGCYAVGSFNIINLEYAIGIIEAAEEEHAPVIIQISPYILQYYRYAPIVSACKEFASSSSIPVCLHLDHGKDFQTVAKSLFLGFSSVMFDGSLLPFQENTAITSTLVQVAHSNGISVEAEIGVVGKDEESDISSSQPQAKFTNVLEAVEFCEKTQIDALAISIGNIHGVSRPSIELNESLLQEIHQSISIPLVLHGSSGVRDASLQQAIRNGICKINVATRIINQVGQALLDHYQGNSHFNQYKTLTKEVINSIKEEIKNRIQVFGSSNKA